MKVAPAVPSFGFALPTLDATALSKGRPMTRAHKHDKIRDGLGLRADSEEAEDSGEEDVDEEAAFAGSTTEWVHVSTSVIRFTDVVQTQNRI